MGEITMRHGQERDPGAVSAPSCLGDDTTRRTQHGFLLLALTSSRVAWCRVAAYVCTSRPRLSGFLGLPRLSPRSLGLGADGSGARQAATMYS